MLRGKRFWLWVLLLAYPATAWGMRLPVERRVLDNGLVVILLERRNLPMVTVNLSFRAGAALDPPGLEGLANLTCSLLTAGTLRRSALQIAEEIDFVGGVLSTSTGLDYAELDLAVLSKDVEVGFDVLADVVLRPTFPEDELERERREVEAALLEQEEEPVALALKEFYRLVYAPHPYWHFPEGTLESIKRIQRQDVQQFYRRYFRPDNAVLVVVGDLGPAELSGLLGKYFKGWQIGKLSFPEPPKPTPKKGLHRVIDKPFSQATILLGHLGISRRNPDYYAVYTMNYILGGGGFSSRLLRRIRDDLGLAYSASSSFKTGIYPGSFQVLVQTKNESAAQVIQAIREELSRIREEPVRDEELAAAKDFITGSFPLKLDTNSKVAAYLTYIEHFDLGLDYFQKFPEYIRRVTKEDILRVARKYIRPEDYILVVVGDKSKLKLSSDGKTFSTLPAQTTAQGK